MDGFEGPPLARTDESGFRIAVPRNGFHKIVLQFMAVLLEPLLALHRVLHVAHGAELVFTHYFPQVPVVGDLNNRQTPTLQLPEDGIGQSLGLIRIILQNFLFQPLGSVAGYGNPRCQHEHQQQGRTRQQTSYHGVAPAPEAASVEYAIRDANQRLIFQPPLEVVRYAHRGAIPVLRTSPETFQTDCLQATVNAWIDGTRRRRGLYLDSPQGFLGVQAANG